VRKSDRHGYPWSSGNKRRDRAGREWKGGKKKRRGLMFEKMSIHSSELSGNAGIVD
jgi:hypothetical protein